MIKSFFKRNNYITVSKTSFQNEDRCEKGPNIPEGTWVKCNSCGKIIYSKDMINEYKSCKYCGYYFRLNPRERAKLIFDEENPKKIFENIRTSNPLNFPEYDEKINKAIKNSGETEAVTCYEAHINGEKVVACIMNSEFFMGSMGSALGEKITRCVEMATEKKLPLIIFTASGGARMQEGMFSLMQMAKVNSALKRLHKCGGLYISVLTDPTTGGVTASFAMIADIVLGEKGALVGFAGRRVIENTIKENLPENFQTVEFLLEKGFIDKIVERKNLKEILCKIILMHKGGNYFESK